MTDLPLRHRNNSLLKSSTNFEVPCSTESTLLLTPNQTYQENLYSQAPA